jgi:hypothetical protein
MRSATVVFPVPGLPVKLICSEGRGGEPDISPQSVDDEQGSDLADARLDRVERHELAIEPLEH